MINSIIIEDEPLNLARLESMVNKCPQDIKVVATLSSVLQSINWFRDNSVPDLIFLDIQLGDGTAFDLLREINKQVPIIFTTAYDEYAVKAFEYNSIDYLLKPVTQEKLIIAIDKYISRQTSDSQWMSQQSEGVKQVSQLLQGTYKQRFLVKLGDQYFPVDVSDIRFFMLRNGAIWIYTVGLQPLIIEFSLDQLEKLVSPMDFFRINRQYLVSVASIGEIHSFFNSRLLLKLKPNSPEEVIVSRERVSDFKKWIDL
jgi:two-component system response regulator LytT